MYRNENIVFHEKSLFNNMIDYNQQESVTPLLSGKIHLGIFLLQKNKIYKKTKKKYKGNIQETVIDPFQDLL